MNVLAPFDGCSCGQVALNEAGIPYDKYYASEIDRYAITVTQANHPNTIQLGDIMNWRNWDIDWSSIDLLIGGSPCQGFSFAGNQLAFDDPRSVLFFVYVDILKYLKSVNPDVKFMLENVRMKKTSSAVITQMLGVDPVRINSNLVSAQNRVRDYWCNWNVDQPEDKKILLSDIIEGAVCSYLIPRGNNKGGIRALDGKIGTVTSCSWENNNFLIYQKDKPHKQRPQNKKASTLTGGANSGGNHSQMDVLVFDGNDIPLTDGGRIDIHKAKNVRRYSPVECERLQTLPDNYTNHVSNSQRYKMIGSGWTIDVIVHILQQLFVREEK